VIQVNMVALDRQHHALGTEIEAAVLRVLRSGHYIGGPGLAEFEAQAAAYLGVPHAIGVSSGTDALLVSLMALGVGPGDRVITPGLSFFASAGCIARLSAVPLFLDVEPDSYNLDPKALAHWCEAHPSELNRVKAMIVVHLFGQCAQMQSILSVADRYGIPVVEDAAQAFGTTYPLADGPRFVGTLGKLGCFSFFPTKNLGAAGDGGLVITSDGELAEQIRTLRSHGAKPKYFHGVVGGNFRLDPVQAAILSVKLPHLDAWNQIRRTHAVHYDEALNGLEGLTAPVCLYGRAHHIYHQYVVRLTGRRDALAAHLARHGIETQVYYPRPLHLQTCFESLGYLPGTLPIAEDAAKNTLAIPVHAQLTAEERAWVVQAVIEFFAPGRPMP
jgi:dTDP-4-amino-4,6-dideoxygalactose transaminase